MIVNKASLYGAAVAFVLSTSLHGQFLVTFQGPAVVSQDPTVAFFDSSTLAPGPVLSVPGAFQFLSLADGSELYLITNNTGAAITVLHPNTRSGPHSIGNFANPLNCGALTPDGSRLVVGENAVHILDTRTNIDLTPNGIAVGAGAAIIGLAISYDSQTAYALATYNGSSYLSAISISGLSVTNTMNITGTATAIALGPNALIYVSVPSQILEINPATLMTTPAGTIPVDATPGKLVFTPDGNYALAANQVYGSQPAILLLNLNDHAIEGSAPFTGLATLATSPLTGTPTVFDQLFALSPSTAYAFSSAAQTLYEIQIGSNGGLALETPVIPGVTLTALAAVAFTNDLGVPGRNFPQAMYTVSSGIIDGSGIDNLFRIDPASLQLTQQLALTPQPGAVAYFAPTLTSNPPTTTLLYNNNQTLPPGGVSLPLVVRVLDQNGLPIAATAVSFTVGSGTGTLSPMNTVTGSDGYAQTIFTAGSTPADIGSITIAAAIGGIQPLFNVNVGTAQTGDSAALNIVSGQGQVILENPITATLPAIAPMVVEAVDTSGNPVTNALITFTIVSGAGFLTALDGSQATVVVVPTDPTGQASIVFTPSYASSNLGFQQASVSASANTGTVDSNNNPIYATQTFYLTTMALDVQYCGNPPCDPPISPLMAQVLQPPAGTVFTGGAGATLTNPVKVQVYASLGPAVPNVGVSIGTGNGGGPNASCAGTNGGLAMTDATGVATCTMVLNGVPGSAPLTISVPEAGIGDGSGLLFSDYSLTITAGAPANIDIISGNNQVVTSGAKLPAPLLVKVTDSSGNTIPGAPVTWKVIQGSLSLTGASTVTTVGGEAIANGTATSVGGTTINVQLTVGSVSVTFTILVYVPATSIQVVSGNNQSAVINSPLAAPLVVQALDGSGKPASFAPVVFVASGAETLSATSATADVNGQASVTVTSAGPVAGAFKVLAETGVGKSPPTATFTLTALPLGPQSPAILNGASLLPSISPGAIVAFVGAGLTPTIQGVVTDPTQMNGYSVSFDGISAPILALVNQNGVQQINAQVPFEEQASNADDVTIVTPQGTAQLQNVNVSNLSPGIFTSGTVSAFGKTYPLAVVTRPDGSYVSASNPALRGENVTFFATGLGQTAPNASTGVPGEPGQIVGGTLYAGVNNQGDAVVSAVYQPNAIGVYDVAIQIPANTAAGPAQPLGLFMADLAGNGYSAQPAYIPIQ